MNMRLHRPRPPLDRFIECFWHLDGDTPGHTRERLLPTGSVSIVFKLRDDRIRVFADDTDPCGENLGQSVVIGPYARYFVLDTSRPRASVGIYFRPGGASALLGESAHAFANRHVALGNVWGRAAAELSERLSAPTTPEAAFSLVEQTLIARLREPPRQHPAVAFALRQMAAKPALARISDLRAETGYAPKRFIELFRDAVGLTPKSFCRVQRFQQVIDRLARGGRVEWAAVAADGGYCDQSHLNREFRAFAGITPGQYRPAAANSPNHVPIHD